MDDKIKLKSSIIETCRQQHLNTIENLTREMDEHQQLANEYGPPKDRYDAFRSQMLRRRDIFAEQLQKANLELASLDMVNPEELKTKVEFGAVVITSHQKLFVCISMGKVTVGKDTWFAISPNVPLFQVLKGLKPGDTAVFNNNTIQIIDVF
ncbi:MAG TPA: hypothetical protein PKW80_07250 [Bacteroidales bacterium]|nr:hypothetical protein [Bacteroidales bacterium]